MRLFSNWLGVWPKDLPRLYPQFDDRSLSAFLTDADYARIRALPVVVVLPFASEESPPLDRAFGVVLARLLIRDLMLISDLSVHDSDDTPHLYLESPSRPTRTATAARSGSAAGLRSRKGFAPLTSWY